MTTQKAPSQYAGCCNPPRNAKRRKTGPPEPVTATSHSAGADPTLLPSQRLRPHILPKDSASTAHTGADRDSDDDEEDEYDPGEAASAPKRRGRKPGSMSRSARESLRKLNHSRIEKARRTKINETLATLSDLVNRDRPAADMQEEASTADGKGKGAGKGEFKLDVLVKTVSYMQELIAKVNNLEAGNCSRCSGSLSTPTLPLKRKRSSEGVDVDVDDDALMMHEADDSYIGDDENGGAVNEGDDEQTSPLMTGVSRASSHYPTPSPCLPPIASWLPHPYVDPSCIAALSQSPNSFSVAAGAAAASQLPSPPLSDKFRPAIPSNMQLLPTLTLPGPAHPLPDSHSRTSSSSVQGPGKGMRISVPLRRLSSASAGFTPRSVGTSPSVSPTWTPEDETAASLLLQMSSSPGSSVSSSSSALPSTMKMYSQKAAETSLRGSDIRRRERNDVQSARPLQAETPSSLLGLGRDN